MSYPRGLAVLLCEVSVVLVPIACAGEEATGAGTQAGAVTGVIGAGVPDGTKPDDAAAGEAPPDMSALLAVDAGVPDSWVRHEYGGVTVRAPVDQPPSGYADEEVDVAVHPLADDSAAVGGEVEVWTVTEPATTPEALLAGADCSLSGTDLAFGRTGQSELDRQPVSFQGHEAVFCEGSATSGEQHLVVMAAVDEETADSFVRVAVRAPTRDEAEALLASALSGVSFA